MPRICRGFKSSTLITDHLQPSRPGDSVKRPLSKTPSAKGRSHSRVSFSVLFHAGNAFSRWAAIGWVVWCLGSLLHRLHALRTVGLEIGPGSGRSSHRCIVGLRAVARLVRCWRVCMCISLRGGGFNLYIYKYIIYILGLGLIG